MLTTQQLLGSVLLSALLIGSALPVGAAIGRPPLNLDPTAIVKVHTGRGLTLQCGNRIHPGAVQYWYTPFGWVRNTSVNADRDPVAMQHDGSLRIHSATRHHSGRYYCLLLDRGRNTPQPHPPKRGEHNRAGQPHTVGRDSGENSQVVELQLTEDDRHDRTLLRSFLLQVQSATSDGYDRDEVRPRRSVQGHGSGYDEERVSAATVSDGQFAAAVAASVVVTFLVGFSTGALSREPLDRCIGGTRGRVRSLRRRRHRTTEPDRCAEVTMATLPPLCENGALEEEEEEEEEESRRESRRSQGGDKDSAATASPATLTPEASPPVKPQRSFKNKREEEPDREKKAAYLEGCDHDGRGEREEGRTGGEGENGGREGRSYDSDGGEVKEEEGSLGDGSGGGHCGSQSKQEALGADGVRREGREEDEGRGDSEGDGEDTRSPPPRGRRSRVIRLYQYDEEGLRYGHLPDAAATSETDAAPKPKPRSLSLTRLNAIMAAASANPLEPPPRRDGETEERGTQERGLPSPPGQERGTQERGLPSPPGQERGTQERGLPSPPGQERPVFQLEI